MIDIKFSAKSNFLLEFLKTVLSSRKDILLSLLLIQFLIFVTKSFYNHIFTDVV